MVGCNVGKLVKKPCSFLKVKSRFIRNNPVCVNQLVPEFNAHSTDCELSHSDVNVSIGICWDKLGVFQSVLDLITFWKRKTMFLLQKCYYLIVLCCSWIMSDLMKTYHSQSSCFVVSNLVDGDTAHITADFLLHHLSSLKKHSKKIYYK